jgi:hypothetical protein
MIDKTETLKIHGIISVLGIIMAIISIYLFILLYPTLIIGLTILLITVLMDSFWIRIIENNDLGRLHLFGTIFLVIGVLAIDIFSGSWIVFISKVFLFVIIFLGAIFCFIIIKKTN